jgi:3-oxoacyl-(acyl-carrier-protein) synthase
MIGHALGAAGGLESVASILMVERGFVHPCINCEDVHPEIEMHGASIPHSTLELPDLDILVKAGFGFGDVNACLVFKRYRA